MLQYRKIKGSDEVAKVYPKPIDGTLRKFSLRVPEIIRECSGITVFGKRIKSLVFSTDVAIIRNVNADAVIAVYPFTPQPVITQAILQASDIPVFVGVGGGLTQGQRVLNLSNYAEMQGAMGVVLNAPTSNEVVHNVSQTVDIPTIVTVVREDEDISARIEAGASVLNVSAAAKTPDIVRKIRAEYPDIPIIATGGPTDESIKATIDAGANAITWTPPSNGEIFKSIMAAYRNGEPHP
ncbi:MAG: hydrolase [Clostridia bacterium]|nr:hydrolase [Clostridia bacterium]